MYVRVVAGACVSDSVWHYLPAEGLRSQDKLGIEERQVQVAEQEVLRREVLTNSASTGVTHLRSNAPTTTPESYCLFLAGLFPSRGATLIAQPFAAAAKLGRVTPSFVTASASEGRR